MAEPKRDKPIIFSGPLVRALLDGRKTQTRRILKPQPEILPLASEQLEDHELRGWECIPTGDDYAVVKRLPYAPGDRLWVREAFAKHACAEARVYPRGDGHPWGSPIYRATFGGGLLPECEGFAKWRPSIHMPRWASRLTLTVTDVRVQRLQEISKEDAVTEGLIKLPATGRYVVAKGDQYFDRAAFDPRTTFAWLWEGINGEGAWGRNEWVAALTFDVHHCNIDELANSEARRG